MDAPGLLDVAAPTASRTYADYLRIVCPWVAAAWPCFLAVFLFMLSLKDVGQALALVSWRDCAAALVVSMLLLSLHVAIILALEVATQSREHSRRFWLFICCRADSSTCNSILLSYVSCATACLMPGLVALGAWRLAWRADHADAARHTSASYAFAPLQLCIVPVIVLGAFFSFFRLVCVGQQAQAPVWANCSHVLSAARVVLLIVWTIAYPLDERASLWRRWLVFFIAMATSAAIALGDYCLLRGSTGRYSDSAFYHDFVAGIASAIALGLSLAIVVVISWRLPLALVLGPAGAALLLLARHFFRHEGGCASGHAARSF